MEIHSERKKRLSLSLLFKIIKDTVWGFIDDSVMRLSASLAYATLFSIIPFLSLLVTVGVFLSNYNRLWAPKLPRPFVLL